HYLNTNPHFLIIKAINK
ncbi:hypothetical protein COK23_13370, partial [Bacillus cereus]